MCCLKTGDILLQYDIFQYNYQNQGMTTKTAFLSNHRLYMDLAICPSSVLYNTRKNIFLSGAGSNLGSHVTFSRQVSQKSHESLYSFSGDNNLKWYIPVFSPVKL